MCKRRKPSPLFRNGLLVVLLCGVLFASGCWGRTEINDIAIAIAASVDQSPDHKIRFSEQVFVPSEQGGAPQHEMPYYVVTGNGRNIREAHQDLQRQLSRRLFLADRNLYLISEDMARVGVHALIDEISRNPQSRLRTDVAVTEGEAVKYLKMAYPFEFTPGASLRKLIFGGQSNFQVDVKTIMRTLDNRGDNLMTPMISLAPTSPGGPKKFIVSGIAIFNKDRMIGKLSGDDAESVLWLRDQMHSDVLTFALPGFDGNVTCILLRNKTTFDVTLHGNHPAMRVTLRPEVVVRENNTNLDMNNPDTVALVQSALNETLKTKLDHTLQVLQGTYKTDVVSFCDRVYRAAPEEWEASLGNHWNEEFAKMPVTVDVIGKVRRVGMTGASLTRKPVDVKK